jgi:NAD(P)H dehydrogenase (quinone)
MTHLTTIPFFTHQGIIHVTIGFSAPYLGDVSEAHGGSPYGVSTLVGPDGKRTPSAGELEVAEHQGTVRK